MYTKKKVLENVKKSWLNILDNDILNKIIFELNQKQNSDFFPLSENIFETFKFFETYETKVILLGQDPYHNIKNGIPQANGLSFSVNDNYPVPPSLKNIYKELKNEYKNFKIPKHGNLKKWLIQEKILLLNCSLTVEKHKAGSHMKLWKNYTNNIIKYISENCSNVVFILLGNFAQNKIKFINKNNINNNKIKIINSVHPSPLSVNKGFWNSNIFIKTNNYFKLIDCQKKLQLSKILNKKKNSLSEDLIYKISLLINNQIDWQI